MENQNAPRLSCTLDSVQAIDSTTDRILFCTSTVLLLLYFFFFKRYKRRTKNFELIESSRASTLRTLARSRNLLRLSSDEDVSVTCPHQVPVLSTGMGQICKMERLRHGKRHRARREGRRGRKLFTSPLFIQVLSVLHMSAFCNGALAVTSAVRYEHKTDLAAGDLESDGGMGSSTSKTPSFSLRNKLISSRSERVRHRCVASAADWKRPRDAWQGESSYLSVVSSYTIITVQTFL